MTLLLTAGDAVVARERMSFTVDPTQIYLAGRVGSALLTLRNESEETLRFQLSVFSWDQSPAGEMKLEPTEDIVFFPVLLSLKPGEARRIRVGSATSFAAREKTYRIFVEELAPPNPVSTGVRVLPKMGIPIFLRPAKEVATATLQGLEQRENRVRFSLLNAGTVHLVPRSVTVRGLAGTTAVFAQPLESWYVLAGGRRDFEMALPEAECSNVTSLLVDIEFGSDRLQQRLQTPGGACRR